MTWRVVKCILNHHDQKTRGIDLLVLLYLANHASNDDGSGAWPSQRTLAGKTGLAYRTVQYALTRLLKAGAVEIEQRPGKSHRFHVRMCAVCGPSPSAQQVPTRANPPTQQVHIPTQEMPGTHAPDATDPLFYSSQGTSQHAVGASPTTEAAPSARPASSESQLPASNRKVDPTPPESARDEFIARRVEQIRTEQGDRAAAAYLAKVAQNEVEDERRAEVERLQSGVTPEGYGGYVPPKLQAQWDALHRDTDLGQEPGP